MAGKVSGAGGREDVITGRGGTGPGGGMVKDDEMVDTFAPTVATLESCRGRIIAYFFF